MRGRISRLIIAVLLLLSVTATGFGDIRIKKKVTTREGDAGYVTILYVRGNRQREEIIQPPRGGRREFSVAYVQQCDLEQFVWIDLLGKRYSVHKGGEPLAKVMAFNEPQMPVDQARVDRYRARTKSVLNQTTTVIDTGERREMFGFIARHLKTITVWEFQPKKCEGPEMKHEIDGWYVDLFYGVDCSPDLSGSIIRGTAMPEGKCFAKQRNYWLERKYNGPVSLGFPLIETSKHYTRKGEEEVFTTEVVELSRDDLDASLFEAPAGFTVVEPRPYRKPLLERVFSFIRRD